MKITFPKNRIKVHSISLYMCFIMILTLSGCQTVHNRIEKLTHGKMSGVATDCRILSVEGTTSSGHYICKNSTHTYIYQNNAIYDYKTMEKLIKAEDLEFMACNDDMLYYSVSCHDGQLFCYDFSEKTSTLISEEFRVTGMRANGDDVFVSQRDKDGKGYINGKTAVQRIYEVIYYHKKENGISLKEWAKEHKGQSISDDYETYEFEGYEIVADKSLGQDNPRFVFIGNEDGFQYSCYGYNTYNKINGKYLRIGIDVKTKYLGIEKELLEIMTADTAEAGLSAAQIGFYDDKAWMIVQYGKGTPGYQENPTKDFKSTDAFFEFSPETNKCRKIYQIQEGEQIAGYSYTKNCLYLLRNEGVYEYDLKSGNEKCVFENKGYKCLAFDYFEDRLFIFHDSYSPDSGVELVSVVD